MRLSTLILVTTLSACSYTSRDTELVLAESSLWKAESSTAQTIFSTPCGQGQLVVTIDKVISSDGKLYSIFLVPIGTAGARDKPYNGLEVSIRYPVEAIECSVSDVSLVAAEGAAHPSLANAAPELQYWCTYQFKPNLQESGQFVLQLHRPEICPVTELKLRYKAALRHHYDAIQG
jgi:hypothetical protein